MFTRVCLSAAVIISASTVSSQTQPALAPLIESVDVKIINVDVTVTDGSGKPVNDLTKDDFEVTEDGRPQTIKNFSVTQRKMRSSEGGSLEAMQRGRRRKVIVLVDNNYIDSRERSLTLDTLDSFIDDR